MPYQTEWGRWTKWPDTATSSASHTPSSTSSAFSVYYNQPEVKSSNFTYITGWYLLLPCPVFYNFGSTISVYRWSTYEYKKNQIKKRLLTPKGSDLWIFIS